MERRIINPWSWQDRLGFVQAHEVSGAGRVLLCAGQTSMDAEGHSAHVGDMRGQVALALDNLEAVLRDAGLTLADVVRLNYYTTDVDAFFGAYDIVMERLAGAGCRPAKHPPRGGAPGLPRTPRRDRSNGSRVARSPHALSHALPDQVF